MERFPDDEIIPVALVTEREEHDIAEVVTGGAAGEEFLRFRTRVVQLAREDAARWVATSNLVATTQLLAMGGAWDRIQKLIAATEAFRECATDEEIALLFPLFVELGRLTEEEEDTAMSYLATMPKPRLLVKLEKAALQEARQEARQEGLRQNAMDNARKMLERGCDWPFITDVTGIRPEDLPG